jgi:hypothetical protein
MRAAILEVLRIRFGAPAPSGLAAALDEMDDLDQLNPLLEVAVTCDIGAGFQTDLRNQVTTP